MFDRLLIASHNAGKLREISALLAPLNINVISAAELHLPEPEETESTFEGNASLKARAAANASSLPALSDDSGLCIPALSDAPGIYSARWAGPNKDFSVAFARIERELRDAGHIPTGTPAYFVCVLALAFPEGNTKNEDSSPSEPSAREAAPHVSDSMSRSGGIINFRGEVHGHLTFPPRGSQGFGYDPVFIPMGYEVSFAEMEPAQKHAMSHRARAFDTFVTALKNQGK